MTAFNAIKEQTAAGATTIIAKRLYEHYAQGMLPGKWLVVDDFKDPRIAARLQPFLGEDNVARFRFKHQVVEFLRGKETDSIEVQVKPRS
jgi:hypothetical protein